MQSSIQREVMGRGGERMVGDGKGKASEESRCSVEGGCEGRQ